MSQTRPLARAFVAACGIVAVAIAAASLESPLEFGSDGDGGVGNGDGDGASQPPPLESPDALEVPAFLEYLAYALVVLLAIALVWYLVAHRRRVVKLVAVCLLVGAILAALVEFLPAVADSQPVPAEPSAIVGNGDGGTGDETAAVDSFSISPLLVVLALAAAIFVGGVALTRDIESTADPDDDPPVDATRSDTVTAVGDAAGRTADRLEAGATVDNEVYRAWRAMTALLEVDRPESTTPREFAGLAVESGIDPDDTDALTALFEDVRYGGREATPAMEARATTVFRRIEAEYATGADGRDQADSDDGDGSSVDGGTHGWFDTGGTER